HGLTTLVLQPETNIAPYERHRGDSVCYRAPLGARSAQELPPGRRIVKQGAYLHRGAASSRGLHNLLHFAARCPHLETVAIPRGGDQFELRYRADRRQCFAAETEARDAHEVR